MKMLKLFIFAPFFLIFFIAVLATPFMAYDIMFSENSVWWVKALFLLVIWGLISSLTGLTLSLMGKNL